MKIVIELVGPLAEIACGTYQLMSLVCAITVLGSAVRVLTPAAGAAAGASVVARTIFTIITPLIVGSLVLLSDNISPPPLSCVTYA